MKPVHQWSAVLLSLAVAAVAAAQRETPATVEYAAPTAKAVAPEMREDVEILRRLLERGLSDAYGLSGKAQAIHSYGALPIEELGLATRNVMTTQAHPAPLVEGVYLKGYGVVYTTTLPAPVFGPATGSLAPPGSKAPADPWERTRKELHGETPESEGTAPAHRPLSEGILKVLANYGRRLTGLGENERITVAVTFRGTANCASCHQSVRPGDTLPLATFKDTTGAPAPGGSFSPGMSSPPGMMGPAGSMPSGSSFPPGSFRPGGPGFPFPGGSIPPPGGTLPSAPSAGPSPDQPGETPEWQADVRNDVLLGDLHLKQGKGQDAVSAYHKALVELEQGIDHKRFTQKGYMPSDLPVLLTSVELCNKLAQAYVAAGNENEARGMLRNAARLAGEAEKLTGADPRSRPPAGASALPAQLIVTAPSKKLLEEVGTGKMTFEEFSKAATVEYVGALAGDAPQPTQATPDAGGK